MKRYNLDDLATLSAFVMCCLFTCFFGWAIYRTWALYFEPDYYREISLGCTVICTVFNVFCLSVSVFCAYCLNREMR